MCWHEARASCLAMDGQVQTMVRLPPSREALVPMENVQGLSLWLRSVANSEVLEEIKPAAGGIFLGFEGATVH